MLPWVSLTQGYLTWALWTFGKDNALLWEAVQCIIGCLSSIPALYPLYASSIPNQKCLDIAKNPLGGNTAPWLRSTGFNIITTIKQIQLSDV